MTRALRRAASAALIVSALVLATGAPALAHAPSPGGMVEYYREWTARQVEWSIAPSAPTDLRAELQSRRTASLTWTASSPGVYGFATYNVYRWDSVTSWYSYFSSTELAFTDTGLQRGVAYVYYVEACDDRGNCSAWSNRADVTPS